MQVLLTSSSNYDSPEVLTLRSNLILIGFDVVVVLRAANKDSPVFLNTEGFLPVKANGRVLVDDEGKNPIILTSESNMSVIQAAYDAGFKIRPDIFVNGINLSRSTKIDIHLNYGIQDAVCAVARGIPALCITQHCDKPNQSFERISDTASDVVISMVTNPPPTGTIIHIGAPAHTVSYQLSPGELLSLPSAAADENVSGDSADELHFPDLIHITPISVADNFIQQKELTLWMEETLNTLNPRFLNHGFACACCA